MKQIVHFLLFIALFPYFAQSQCTSCNTSISTNSSANITIPANTTYCFTGGTFTGTITDIPSTSNICVLQNAVFNPSQLNGTLAGSLQVYGTANLPSLIPSSNFFIKNYGKNLTFNTININGGVNNFVISTAGGSYTYFNNDLNLSGSGNAVVNNGIIRMSGQFNPSAGGTLTNQGDLRLANTFNIGTGSIVTNNGMVNTTLGFNINANSTVVNNCRFISRDGFINNAQISNNGIIWVTGGSGAITNNGSATITMGGASSSIRGANFTNDGTINGYGNLYFTANTQNQGTFTGSSATNQLQVFDVSQTGSQIFDLQNGTATNTIRPASMTPPDTLVFGPCTNPNYQATTATILPIYLKYFQVNTSNNLLKWEVENASDIAYFILERSNDGVQFSTFAKVAAGIYPGYEYPINTNDGFTFYKLKLLIKSGSEVESQILSLSVPSNHFVQLQSLSGLHLLRLNSNVPTNEAASIKVFDVAGKQVMNNILTLMAGHQQQTISMPENLHGMFFAQVISKQQTVFQKIFVE